MRHQFSLSDEKDGLLLWVKGSLTRVTDLGLAGFVKNPLSGYNMMYVGRSVFSILWANR